VDEVGARRRSVSGEGSGERGKEGKGRCLVAC